MALRLHSFQRTSQASLPVVVLVLTLLSCSVCNGQSQSQRQSESQSLYAQYTRPSRLFAYFVVDFKTINITTSEPIADLLSRFPNATGLNVDIDIVPFDQPKNTNNALYSCGLLTTQRTSCSLTLTVNPASGNDLFIRYRAMKRSTLFGFSSVDTLQITKGSILTPPLVTNVTANESTATVRYLLQQKEAAMFNLMQKSNVTVVIEVGCVEPEELCMSSGSGSGSNSGGRTRRYVASLDLNSTVYECDGLEQNRLWRGEIWLEMADSGYNSSRSQFEFRTSEGAESHLFVILIAAFIGFLVLTVASVAVWYAAKRRQMIGKSMRSANNRETERLDLSSRFENQTRAITRLATVDIDSAL